MQILRLRDVIHTTGLGRSSIYKFSGQGLFPRPITLGGMSVGWRADRIDRWIVERIRERDSVAGNAGHYAMGRHYWKRRRRPNGPSGPPHQASYGANRPRPGNGVQIHSRKKFSASGIAGRCLGGLAASRNRVLAGFLCRGQQRRSPQ